MLDGDRQIHYGTITGRQAKYLELWTKKNGYHLEEIQKKSIPHPTMAIMMCTSKQRKQRELR